MKLKQFPMIYLSLWVNLMIVKITDYGSVGEKYFIDYEVREISHDQMNYLNDNLNEQTVINDESFGLKMFFEEKLYPFQSDVAKIRLEDFIAREEIEMTIFLSSFLEDM